MSRPYAIFCLEGIWEEDLRKPVTVLPTLELLKNVGEIDFIHRHAGTVRSMADLLERRVDSTALWPVGSTDHRVGGTG